MAFILLLLLHGLSFIPIEVLILIHYVPVHEGNCKIIYNLGCRGDRNNMVLISKYFANFLCDAFDGLSSIRVEFE